MRIVGGFEPEQDAREGSLRSREEKVPPGPRLEAGRLGKGALARIEALAQLRPGCGGDERDRD